MGETQTAPTSPGDRAGSAYWNELWSRSSWVALRDPRAPGRWNFPYREAERFVRAQLAEVPSGGRRLLELGCARSRWMPYFAGVLGFDVTGIDYSPEGCKQAREVMDQAGVQGEVVCSDFFAPPDSLLGKFDVVFSWGVVEHFDDTARCIANFERFLVPGGRLVTVIPNMTGVPGFLQRSLNREVFDKHVPLTADDLKHAYQAAGLSVTNNGYLVSSNPGIINLEGLEHNASWWAKKALMAALLRVSAVGWYFEERIARLPSMGATASFVQCVGEKTHTPA